MDAMYTIAVLFSIYLGVLLLLLTDFKLRYHVYVERFEDDIYLNDLDEKEFKVQIVTMMFQWPIKLESLCG